MNIEIFEKKILERGLQPIHLILDKGKQVKWFVCVDEVIGHPNNGVKEYCLVVFDKGGRCFVNPKRFTEINRDTPYYIIGGGENYICVNNDTFESEPLCDLNFSDEP